MTLKILNMYFMLNIISKEVNLFGTSNEGFLDVNLRYK